MSEEKENSVITDESMDFNPSSRLDYVKNRPKEWDELYGPWGCPPGFVAPGMSKRQILDPKALKMISIGCALAAILIVLLGAWTMATAGLHPWVLAVIIANLIMLVPMSVQCGNLGRKRAQWLASKET